MSLEVKFVDCLLVVFLFIHLARLAILPIVERDSYFFTIKAWNTCKGDRLDRFIARFDC